MKKLLVYFDKKISLKEFDKQIPKLVNNFPKNKKILINLRQTKNNVLAILKENPNPTSNKRWEWSEIK